MARKEVVNEDDSVEESSEEPFDDSVFEGLDALSEE